MQMPRVNVERLLKGNPFAIREVFKTAPTTYTDTLHNLILRDMTEQGVTLQGKTKLINKVNKQTLVDLIAATKDFNSVTNKSYYERQMYIKQVKNLIEAKGSSGHYLKDALLQVSLDYKVSYTSLSRDYKINETYGFNDLLDRPSTSITLTGLPALKVISAYWNVEEKAKKTADLTARFKAAASIANEYHIRYDQTSTIVKPSRGKARQNARELFIKNIQKALQEGLLTEEGFSRAREHYLTVTQVK